MEGVKARINIALAHRNGKNTYSPPHNGVFVSSGLKSADTAQLTEQEAVKDDCIEKRHGAKLLFFNQFTQNDIDPSQKMFTPLTYKVTVEVTVIFLKIGEIDTLKENYEADVLVKSRWREPLLDKEKEDLNISFPIDWSKYWNPKLYIENVIGEPRESSFLMLNYNVKGEAYVIEKRRIKGVFLECLELKDFPFDVQDLTVTVMSERPNTEIDIKENPRDLHKINKQSFIDEQEWYLYKCIDTELREVTNDYEDPTIRKCSMEVKCRAARRPAYFFWNIFLITFLICSLTFATFAVDRTKPQNRLQLSFTLVLTAVAFKFVVNQSLPKISYLTYLDKYVLVAMILLTMVCAWHGLTTVFNENNVGDRIAGYIDTAALSIFASFYIIFNLGFIIRIATVPGKKRKVMKEKQRIYAELLKEELNLQLRTAREHSVCMSAI